MGYRVYHEVPLNESLIINIGSNSIRKRLAEKFNSVNFATAIHPSSVGKTLPEFLASCRFRVIYLRRL